VPYNADTVLAYTVAASAVFWSIRPGRNLHLLNTGVETGQADSTGFIHVDGAGGVPPSIIKLALFDFESESRQPRGVAGGDIFESVAHAVRIRVEAASKLFIVCQDQERIADGLRAHRVDGKPFAASRGEGRGQGQSKSDLRGGLPSVYTA
jgi:hypothetical protein